MANLIERLTSRQPLRNFKTAIKESFGWESTATSSGTSADPCENGTCKKKNCERCATKWNYYSLDEKVQKLPYINDAANLKARLILSQGYEFNPKDETLLMEDNDATKKKIKEDRDKLSQIFSRKNSLGESLNELLIESIEETELYGHTAIQAYDWVNPEEIIFQNLRWNQFLIVGNDLKRKDRGRRKILYYLIDLRGFADESVELKLTEEKQTGKSEDQYRYKVLPEEVVHLKLNHKTPYGLSPLYFNVLMTQFIIDGLKDNIDQINNDGYKGIVLKGVKGMRPADFGFETDTLEENWQDTLIKKFLKALRGTMKGTKNKDNTLYLNGNIVDDIIQLQRGFKSVEYMQHIDAKASVVAASMLGVHPGFLGDRDSTYAQNLEQAIRFAANYAITPAQLRYSDMITTQILDRYFNGMGMLNYEYNFTIKPIDFSDPKVEAEILNLYGKFIGQIRDQGLQSINEAVEWLNNKVDGLDLSKIEDEMGDAGNTKTTVKPLIPVNIEEEEDDSQDPAQEEDVEDDIPSEEED